MALTSELMDVKNISQPDQVRMFRLMELYYENVNWDTFLNDLREKEWALFLKDPMGVIQGFTTIKTFDIEVNNLPVKLVFSGDTIIHKEHWGDLELHRSWIRSIFTVVGENPGKVYWLLVSKGYKTYRFLPVYFHRFYPCFNRKTPEFEKKIMDRFGAMKYQEKYDAARGIISLNGARDHLKKGVADISTERLKNPHIRFFTAKNPHHGHGDELVCLAELSTENMKPMVLRYLRLADGPG